jgi:hypothetical protein
MQISATPHHLTYCTNVHPGEHWSDVLQNLHQHIPPLKQQLAPNQPFGIGLRLGHIASCELLQANTLANFKEWLKQQNAYVFTLNGFPYGSFHHQQVKDQVYAPDWTQPERLKYTLQLVNILATVLPNTEAEKPTKKTLEGGISTLPLSYKPWFYQEASLLSSPSKNKLESTLVNSKAIAEVFKKSTHNIVQVVAKMATVEAQTGKRLHLDIEPEPDGLLENAAEVVAYFEQWLLPLGTKALMQLGYSRSQATDLIYQHVRVCYDTCHFAVAYEDPIDAIAQLQAAGIRIGKLQLSSALKIDLPADPTQRQSIAQKLQPFAESTYLHQVVTRQPNGQRRQYRDLTAALQDLTTAPPSEWRTHFHVPICLANYQSLQSTQNHIKALLQLLPNTLDCPHLEIETYTWEVLPPPLKDNLLNSIQREYEWALEAFNDASTPTPHPSPQGITHSLTKHAQ